MFKRFFSALKNLFALKRQMAELVAQVDNLSPSPAPRNRQERRMLARKGHL